MNTSLHDRVLSAKGVVFDLFHTLTARESEWSEFPYTFQVLGVSRAAWEKQLFDNSRFRLAGEERDPSRIISRMARAIDPAIGDEVVARAIRNRSQRFAKILKNIPADNLALLKALRNHALKLGLVSNADCGEIASWESSPLAPLFDSTVFSCRVGHVKPEPAIFLHCLDELQIHAEDSLFVGDGGALELKTARHLGFTTIMVTAIIQDLWPDKIEERARDADFVVEFPADILPNEWRMA